MKKLALAVFALSTVACAAATPDAPEESASAAEEELKSAECPQAIEVLLQKPTIASDARLLSAWEDDMEYESDPTAAAEEQMTRLSSHVAKARAQNAVKLRGAVGRACAYATVDAKTGKANGYRVWFAKTAGRNGQLQIRIERDLGTPNDALFFTAPLASLSRTAVAADASKSGRVYAQIHESGYHGEPAGPNAWIGGAKVTVTLAQ